MSSGAGVTSIEVLQEWYAALNEFRSEALNALTAVNLSLQGADNWLADQHQFWKQEIRNSEELVTQARAELDSRKYIRFTGEKPDTTVQEEELRRAKARLIHAEEQLEKVRRWKQKLPNIVEDVYAGPSRRLAFFLDAEFVKSLAQLERQLTALEQYTNIRPTSSAPPSPGKDAS